MKKTLFALGASLAVLNTTPAMATSDISAAVRSYQMYQSVGQINKWVVPDNRYTGVGYLQIQTLSQVAAGRASVCTGALVGGQSVLTAAHCFGSATAADPISRISFVLPSILNAEGTTLGREVKGGSGFSVNAGFNGSVLSGYDVAMVTLSSAASLQRDRYDIYGGAGELDNLSYAKIGIGTQGTLGEGTDGPNASFDTLKRLGLNEYEFYWDDVLTALNYPSCSGADSFGAPCQSMLAYDTDSGRATNDVFGRFMGKPDLGRTLYGQNVDAGAAPGDSGGPTFIDGKIAGVTSFGITGNIFEPGDCAVSGSVDPSRDVFDGGCTDSSFGEISVDTRVASYSSWIRDRIVSSTGSVVMPAGFLPLGVPEPAQWAMMLSGFGLLGGALRRRKATVRVTYA